MDGCTQVALVDDHPLARRGLAELLAESGDIEVLASVANASGLEAVARSRGAWPQDRCGRGLQVDAPSWIRTVG
jgi:CheY-like chemotaxis protein